jgi:uncharacterized protein (TIGR03437 family)
MKLKRILLLGFLATLLTGAGEWLPRYTTHGQSAAPAAPTGVTASDNTYNNKVGISWDTMRNATMYRVYRNTTNDPATAVSLGTTAAALFFDMTAVAGQTYVYWVRSENVSTFSALSTPDQGTRASGNAPSLNPPSAPAGNPVTATKATLGKTLFWDEQLSSTRTVSCGTCHHATNGGADPRSISTNTRATHPGPDGAFGTADDIQGSPGVPLSQANGSYSSSATFGLREQVTGRRGMSHINAAYPLELFWDGRASQTFRDPLTNSIVLAAGAALESQILGPPVSDVEMAHTARDWNNVAARVASVKPLVLSPSVSTALTAWIGERGYPELFTEAFGSAEVTPTRIALAIATYERTLFADRTPFDVRDLTEQENRGLQVFNTAGCVVCHIAPLFGNNQFENTGVRPPTEDKGRFAVTNDPLDTGRFRVVSLRNVELRAPYMHNGRFNTLESVVEFYNRGGDFPAANTNRLLIRPLNLTAQQKADLVAFLKRPLTDPRVAAQAPPFDRPQLYSESMRVPQLTGTGLAGTNGAVPQAVALEPPLVGNPAFTVAVSNVLGGAQATLIIDTNDPGAITKIPTNASFALVPLTLSGSGAGKGYGSATLTIPNNSTLVSTTLYGRWYVADPGAANGVAVSQSFKFTIFGTAENTAPAVASISAASYTALVAPDSIVAAFGTNLSTTTQVANTLPLPDTLAGVTVTVRDVVGVERRAPLFFVSANQINYQVPAGTAIGEASLNVTQNGKVVGSGLVQVAPVAPGLFTANANGRGVPAASVLRIKADGAQSYEAIAIFNPATSRYEAVPIDFGATTDQLFLIAYGTGWRYRTTLANVTATIGGIACEVLYAGTQGALVGVDQTNIRLPRALAGRGTVEASVSVDGKTANAVSLSFK